MALHKKIITRRDFLRTGSYVTLGSMIGLPVIDRVSAKTASKSRVVLIRDENLLDTSGKVQSTVMEKVLDQAVTTLLEIQDPESAWEKLIKSNDVVGIKSNIWAPLPTPSALEEAVVKRLVKVGVGEQNISVDDRGVRSNRVFENCTALINMRPMRTHHWSGLGTLIKNYIMFTSMPWAYHANACERLGAIWNKAHVQGKTRLNILVMLTPLFHGMGPHHFSRKYIWPYSGLIVSMDPVAVDATGAEIIQTKRNEYFGEVKPISPRPHHIEAADTKYGLGNSRADRIELIKLGWEKDILI